ncbi:hypothetical protein MO973_44060 [Paenibacillus sp. TRM 82003]|nr:hypothetical protein [Paenibacillus sp. TRM 82003]
MFHHLPVVAFLFFITSIDTLILILSSIRRPTMPRRAMYLLIFGALCAVHPLYSLAVDTFARTPGIRLVSAVVILYLSFRLAGESSGVVPARTGMRRAGAGAIVGLTLWLDAVTSVDTVFLVSAASPSFFVTALGNVIAMSLLFLLVPPFFRWANDSPWLRIVVASFMALSAVLQLKGEALLGAFANVMALYPFGLACFALVGAFGWHRQLR